MFIRYFIVLCFMCYTPTGKYINDEQIKMLWDAFRVNKYYIFLIDLTNVYADEDPNELEDVLKSYGSKYDNKNVLEIGMREENFVSAARDGRFHRWTNWAMTTEFRDIIPEEEHRDYIILDDMIKYYGKNISKPELINVINKYGQLKDGVYQLHFHNFRRALNMGLLPEPLCDESQSLLAIYSVFWGMSKNEESSIITRTSLASYYKPQIDEIFEEYADPYLHGTRILFFYSFKKAVISGNLPIPMYKKHASRQVISKRRLISQTVAKLQIENEKLKREVLALKTMNAQCRDNIRPQVGNSVNNPNQATIQEIRAPYKNTI